MHGIWGTVAKSVYDDPIVTASIWGVFLWLPDGTGEIEPLLGLLASLIKESNGGGQEPWLGG